MEKFIGISYCYPDSMHVLTKPLKPSNDYLKQQGRFPVIFVDGSSVIGSVIFLNPVTLEKHL